MNNALLVGRGKPVRNLDTNVDGLFEGETAFSLSQGLTINELHRDEHLPFIFVNAIDGTDVRMI